MNNNIQNFKTDLKSFAKEQESELLVSKDVYTTNPLLFITYPDISLYNELTRVLKKCSNEILEEFSGFSNEILEEFLNSSYIKNKKSNVLNDNTQEFTFCNEISAILLCKEERCKIEDLFTRFKYTLFEFKKENNSFQNIIENVYKELEYMLKEVNQHDGIDSSIKNFKNYYVLFLDERPNFIESHLLKTEINLKQLKYEFRYLKFREELFKKDMTYKRSTLFNEFKDFFKDFQIFLFNYNNSNVNSVSLEFFYEIIDAHQKAMNNIDNQLQSLLVELKSELRLLNLKQTGKISNSVEKIINQYSELVEEFSKIHSEDYLKEFNIINKTNDLIELLSLESEQNQLSQEASKFEYQQEDFIHNPDL